MDVSSVTRLIQAAKRQPVLDLWPRYDVRVIPFAVYDDHDVQYIDHPSPPISRPENLMAATSVALNGVETATIPTWLCTDEMTALSVAYHEGFHVFQHDHFAKITVDMFTAMAFYPDLDAHYRTFCRLEEIVLNDAALSLGEKMSALKHLIGLRRELLQRHPSLLSYERFLEINEGTAYFVEQRTRQRLFHIAPVLEDVGHGWSWFYKVGAALCWLLDATTPDWMTRVEQGESPSDIIIQQNLPAFDMSRLNYEAVLSREEDGIREFRGQIDGAMKALEQPDVIRIRYQDVRPQYRAFSPQTLVSLGDGRILHPSFFKLLLPNRGTVAVTDAPMIDHIAAGEVILSGISVQLEDGILRAQTDSVQIELTGAVQLSETLFALTP